MDKAAVKKIVDANILPMMRMLAVSHWKVEVQYVASTGHLKGAAATCSRRVDYQIATITIDPKLAGNELDVLHSLRHELLHVVLAQYDLLMDVMYQPVSGNDALEKIANRMSANAVESTVLALERMLDHGLQWNSLWASQPHNQPVSPHLP